MSFDFEPTVHHHQAKWGQLDEWITAHIEGRLCAEAACLAPATVGVCFEVEGRLVEVGLCEAHVVELDAMGKEFPWPVLSRRELDEGEGVDGPEGC